jgi:putative methyltransferase (TIGR04325 family)
MTNLFQKIRYNPLVHRVLVGTSWRGVYPSFVAAQAAIPARNLAGYDNSGGASIASRNAIKRRRPTNYAAFFHVRPLLKPGMRIFDFGGGIGVAYYAFRHYMPFPPDVKWTVCDVQSVIEAGMEVAKEQQQLGEYDTSALQFTADFKDAGGCDLLYSAGALQYVEAGVAELLSTLEKLPPYILLNRIPVWDREALFTLQTIDKIVCPYQIFNQSQLVNSLTALGYRLVDDWECPESTFSVRFRPSLRLNSYRGYYLALSE